MKYLRNGNCASASVRDCSVKAHSAGGHAGWQGEDLQRKARAAGNAIIQLAVFSLQLAVDCLNQNLQNFRISRMLLK
ncbi:hypothetical protein HYN43_018710 [Mucilaginibacter celer]|uniref:Uncharacterized protein n=1 Tax=Mucilaginibacter celer TaxID=2305508 RepID=A0A494VQR4_9SPHI|nr:hypothetical protein HYN43_018710 [Mucilaginibacter celer]